MTAAESVNEEAVEAARYVLDRDGDLWMTVGPSLWKCLTTDSCLVAGADLVNVCGPLVELRPVHEVRAETLAEVGISDEAVGAAAWVLWSSFDVAVTSDEVREALTAALPLLRPSDVPHLERRIRESIAGELALTEAERAVLTELVAYGFRSQQVPAASIIAKIDGIARGSSS